jgi:hypothetical protein
MAAGGNDAGPATAAQRYLICRHGAEVVALNRVRATEQKKS